MMDCRISILNGVMNIQVEEFLVQDGPVASVSFRFYEIGAVESGLLLV